MATCAEVLARTLREEGVSRLHGLPGGEILDVVEAARREGLPFLLTRHEATASLMADVTGQIRRRAGVCVSTLGPGAINMTLGVANAYLDRSPVLAITAMTARANAPVATHQVLDLQAVYRPFTKWTFALDGEDTAAKVRYALELAAAPRMGPVHVAMPSDVAREQDRETGHFVPPRPAVGPAPELPAETLPKVIAEIARARRPIAILGLDLHPLRDAGPVRAFVEALDIPVFVTPKAKGILPEDHRLFYGVCAGVSADPLVVEWLGRADLLIGLGFDPVESDKVWHHTMKMVSIGPMSIAAGQFRPAAEAVGPIEDLCDAVRRSRPGPFAWTAADRDRFRGELEGTLSPVVRPHGLSGFELTRRLRDLFPRDTILVTDVGSVKMITTQAWACHEPGAFFESNGLSTMSYALPGAMAVRLQHPERPVLCTIGDGGFGMTIADLETCVRERLHFVTVVYNDSGLSLIDVAQTRRGYPTTGVRYGPVDFAAAARAFGAWARRVDTMADLESAVREAFGSERPAVIDAVVDPAEYHDQMRTRR